MLIPSLTATSPLPTISDQTNTSGFLVAHNQLLGGDSQRIQSKRNNEKNRQLDAARIFRRATLWLVVIPNKLIMELKQHFYDQFRIKDLSTLKYFLGLEVSQSPKSLVLTKHKYALDILHEFGLLGGKLTSSLPNGA